EPVRITIGDTIVIENRYDFRDLSHLAFTWRLEEEGVTVAEGVLDVRDGRAPLPRLPATSGETWLTVRAVLAADEPWASAGHEVAWSQALVRPAVRRTTAPHRRSPEDLGTFDPVTGRLVSLGGLPVDGPRLDLWR